MHNLHVHHMEMGHVSPRSSIQLPPTTWESQDASTDEAKEPISPTQEASQKQESSHTPNEAYKNNLGWATEEVGHEMNAFAVRNAINRKYSEPRQVSSSPTLAGLSSKDILETW